MVSDWKTAALTVTAGTWFASSVAAFGIAANSGRLAYQELNAPSRSYAEQSIESSMAALNVSAAGTCAVSGLLLFGSGIEWLAKRNDRKGRLAKVTVPKLGGG